MIATSGRRHSGDKWHVHILKTFCISGWTDFIHWIVLLTKAWHTVMEFFVYRVESFNSP